MKKTPITFALFVLLLGFGPATGAESTPPLHVVTSFSILADMVYQIGGRGITVTALVGPDADTHNYQPTPEDAKTLAHADLVIINGLGFEGWMERLIEASGYKGKVIVASTGITPRLMTEDGHEVTDPHAWQNVANGRAYMSTIAAALIAARPADTSVIHTSAYKYDITLRRVDQAIRTAFSSIPQNQRKIITSHDAFGYFGDAYGITFLAPQGMNTENEPSAAAVAKLIEQIKVEKVSTVFIENMTNPKLMEQIARDTGAKMGGALYADALSAPDGPADTYLAMFKNNLQKMKTAMLTQK